MQKFSEWLKLREVNNFEVMGAHAKPWHASKTAVLQHWDNLPPNMPMGQVRIVPVDHKGTTVSYDGLSVTGSPTFIDYVLSRLKEMLVYEKNGSNTRLQVIYRQIRDSVSKEPIPNSFAFYVQVREKKPNLKPQMQAKVKHVPKLKPIV